MLNKNGERELAYAVLIDKIIPIEGADRVEAAQVGGWQTMVPKGRFREGDSAIFFEIDSKLPELECFAFMKPKHYKVKTQRYTFGGKNKKGFYSQGLLVHPDDLEGGFTMGYAPTQPELTFIEVDHGKEVFIPGDPDTMFMTERLGVTYASVDDRKKKAKEVDKYQKMANRLGKKMKNPIIKWLFRKNWGKKILFLFFGRAKDNKRFPTHFRYIHKTDEERCENIPNICETYKDTKFFQTEKLDGTSCTYILERKFPKNEFYVLSRNVRQLTPDQETYHESNIYWELAEKYQIEKVLNDLLKRNPSWNYVCIQGEGVGNVQGNPLKLKENQLFVFNFIDSERGRWKIAEGSLMMARYGIPWVPIINFCYSLPDTFEEFKQQADGKSSLNLNVKREGFVYRSIDDPNISFKNVSRNYLLKHEG